MNQFDITINETLKEQLNEAELVTLQLLSGKVLEMAQSELPKHISSNVDVRNVAMSVTSMKSIKTNDLMPAMLIKGTDSTSKKIPLLLLCKQATMRTCINKIMGLENDSQAELKFDEFDLSAAGEMVNALFQQASIQISEVVNQQINGLTPSVGLFKNFGDFLQTLRLTSDALIAQIQFDLHIENEEPAPCLVVIDFRALSKFIGELGPITMNTTGVSSEPIQDPSVIKESEVIPEATPQTNSGGTMSQDAIEAMLAKKAAEASAPSVVSEPVAPEPASSNGGMLSQDAIEAMLAKKAAEASTPGVAPEPVTSTPSPSSGGMLSQDAIEAMLAKKAAEASTQSVAPEPVTSTPTSGGMLSQDAIEAMLAKKAAEASAPGAATEPVKSEPASSSGGMLSQDAIEAMLAKKAAEASQSSSSASLEKTNSIMEETRSNNGLLSQAAIEEMLVKKELEAKTQVQAQATPITLAASNSITEETNQPLRSITSLHYGNSPQELPLVEEPQTYFSIPMIHSNVDLVMNVPLTVSVEIGKTKKKIKEILEFQPGTVIELDKEHNTPMDVIVNGELFARGEVVVIDENFGIRLTEINSKNAVGENQ